MVQSPCYYVWPLVVRRLIQVCIGVLVNGARVSDTWPATLNSILTIDSSSGGNLSHYTSVPNELFVFSSVLFAWPLGQLILITGHVVVLIWDEVHNWGGTKDRSMIVFAHICVCVCHSFAASYQLVPVSKCFFKCVNGVNVKKNENRDQLIWLLDIIKSVNKIIRVPRFLIFSIRVCVVYLIFS